MNIFKYFYYEIFFSFRLLSRAVLYAFTSLVSLLFSLHGQYIIYSEDFSSQEGKGISGDGTDVSGVNWSVSNLNGTLSGSDDYGKVVGGTFEFQDTDGAVSWISPSTDIANFSGLNLGMDYAEDGSLSSTEYIIIGAFTDGSNYEQLLYQADDYGTASLSRSLSDGSSFSGGSSDSTFSLRVTSSTSFGSRHQTIDNIKLTASTLKNGTLTVSNDNQFDSGTFNVGNGNLYLSDGATLSRNLDLLASTTIYSENFDGQSSDSTVNYNTKTSTTSYAKGSEYGVSGVNTTGVDWTISGGSMDASNEYARVESGQFEFRDVGTDTIWQSPSVSIDGFTGISIGLVAETEGGMEGSDTFQVLQSIDSGSYVTEISQTGDISSSTFLSDSLSGTGSSITLRVQAKNSASTEKHRFDNFSLTGKGTVQLGDNVGGTSTFSGAIALNNAVTLAAASSGKVNFSGAITGSESVTKSGAGIVSITNAGSNYSGSNIIKQGKLEVGNGVSLAGAVTGSGSDKSVVGGDGTVLSVVIGNSSGEVDFVSPGFGHASSLTSASSLNQSVSLNDGGTGSTSDDAAASIGSFTTTNLTLNDGGVFDWEIKDFDGTSPGADYDVLNFTYLSFDNIGSTFTMNILPLDSSNGTAGAPENANLWSQSGSSFKFLDGPSGGSGINWGDWSAGTVNDFFTFRDDELSYYSDMWGSDWRVSYSDGDFYLNYSAVPEPSTYIMVAGLFIITALNSFRKVILKFTKQFQKFFLSRTLFVRQKSKS